MCVSLQVQELAKKKEKTSPFHLSLGPTGSGPERGGLRKNISFLLKSTRSIPKLHIEQLQLHIFGTEMLYASHRSKPGAFLTNGSYRSNNDEKGRSIAIFGRFVSLISIGVFSKFFFGNLKLNSTCQHLLIRNDDLSFLPRQSDDKDLHTSEFHRSFRFLSPPLLAGASPVPPRVTRPVLTGNLHSRSNRSSKKNKMASTIEISSSMLRSSPISDWMCFLPIMDAFFFWLLHLQRILGWLIICLHQEVFSSFLACHVAGSQKNSDADDSSKRNSQQRPLWKIHNDFQGFHPFFAAMCFFNQTQRNPPSTPYPPLPKPSFFLIWLGSSSPFRSPKGGKGNTTPFGQSPPQPNVPGNTSHQRQSTQGFPYRSLDFRLAGNFFMLARKTQLETISLAGKFMFQGFLQRSFLETHWN